MKYEQPTSGTCAHTRARAKGKRKGRKREKEKKGTERARARENETDAHKKRMPTKRKQSCLSLFTTVEGQEVIVTRKIPRIRETQKIRHLAHRHRKTDKLNTKR